MAKPPNKKALKAGPGSEGSQYWVRKEKLPGERYPRQAVAEATHKKRMDAIAAADHAKYAAADKANRMLRKADDDEFKKLTVRINTLTRQLERVKSIGNLRPKKK